MALDNPREPGLRDTEQALASMTFALRSESLCDSGNWEPSSATRKPIFDGSGHPALSIFLFLRQRLHGAGCIEALSERGVDFSGRIAVIGFDNRDIAQFMRPH